jgi:O-antigen ligase/tetratricopeptide (TPR) repeat protein
MCVKHITKPPEILGDLNQCYQHPRCFLLALIGKVFKRNLYLQRGSVFQASTFGHKSTWKFMKEKSRRTHTKIDYNNRLSNAIFWLSVTLLFLVPLVFSTSVRAVYSLPKFVLLLVGAAVLALLLGLYVSRHASSPVPVFKSTQVRLVCAYFAVVALSTIFSVAPMVSLFGSNSNFMGVITRLGFVICFLGLIIGIGTNEERLLKTLWGIAISGGLVSAYAILQFFGLDLFAPVSIYTFQTSLGEVIRVCSSIGHSNYLGNFLLYVAPVSAGLALATNKKERLLAIIITALSLLAIVFSVARGAWIGIIVGTICFIILELKYAPSKQIWNSKNLLRYAAIFLLISSTMAGIIAFTPASRTIKERVQALLTQGVQSSGRVLLWRDSLKMLPRFALTGCGAEGFRKAFLAYKSKEVAKLSQPDNNESSHNSYLDVALSHGILGLALYIAIIISTLTLLLRARRRVTLQNRRFILSGLTASFVAVLTHNFFIFDQLSTGLYFFAFVALAAVVTNVFDRDMVEHKHSTLPQTSQADEQNAKSHNKSNALINYAKPVGLQLWVSRVVTFMAGLALVFAVWYAAGLVESELAFNKIFDPAIARNFQAISQRCEDVVNSPMPTGAYHLMAAKALDTYAQGLLSLANSAGAASPEKNNVLTTRNSALQLGTRYAEQSLTHTNTPDLNYNALALLSIASGDKDKLMFAATEAVKSDPNNFYCRWLMAEAHLANGEHEQAANEANLSLELAPAFNNAASALQRAQVQADEDKARKKQEAQIARNENETGRSVAQVIAYARQLAQQGHLRKAKRKLLMALVRSQGDCLDCRSELANVYEKLGLYAAAIGEWEKVVQQTTDPTSVEQIHARLETLKQTSLVKQQ